jgi:hypothetical protein
MYLAHGGGATASLYEYARAASVYSAFFSGVTSLPAYSATALGPIVYNGATQNPQLKTIIIGISIAVTTASAAAVSVGLAWGKSVPITATTHPTLVTCTYANGKQPACNAYISGTVSLAPLGYLPLVNLDTTALTAQPLENMWIALDGGIVIPQGSFVALAAGATATTSVLDVGIMWAEVKE